MPDFQSGVHFLQIPGPTNVPERVLRAIGPRRDAYVVLETDKALTEAKAIRRLAQGAPRKEGGLGRVIRPRAATVKVRDDEQE